MQKNAIAIFVKTPGLSPLKTRLASKIGQDKALEFFKLSVKATSETLKQINATKYWAVGEKKGLSDPLWQDFKTLWTGPGELGDRQHHIYSKLQQSHENVMLIGADCPQIPAAIIAEAFLQLSSHDFVIGPAEDGGYTLLAGKKSIAKKTWNNVHYSSDKTCAELCSALNGSIHKLPQFCDIDQREDLSKMLQQMPKTQTGSQKILCNWTKEVLKS